MFSALFKVLGLLCVIHGASMLAPFAVALIYDDGHALDFLSIGGASALLGAATMLLGPRPDPHLPGEIATGVRGAGAR